MNISWTSYNHSSIFPRKLWNNMLFERMKDLAFNLSMWIFQEHHMIIYTGQELKLSHIRAIKHVLLTCKQTKVIQSKEQEPHKMRIFFKRGCELTRSVEGKQQKTWVQTK